jgi:hypothetical protein
MQFITKHVGLQATGNQALTYRVLTISHCFFCVYADAALIDIFADWLSANDLCQHLRYKQTQAQAVHHRHCTMNDRYIAV